MSILYNDVRVAGSAGSVSFLDSIGGALPADGDSVVLHKGADRYDYEMDISSKNLAEFVIGRGRLAGIGDLGTPLKIQVAHGSTPRLKNFCGGLGAAVNIVGTGAAAADGDIVEVWNDPAGGGPLSLDECDTERFYNLRGTGIVKSNCDLASAYAFGGTLDLLPSSHAATLAAAMQGALVNIHRDVATLMVRQNGTVWVHSTAVSPGTKTEVDGVLGIIESGTHTSMELRGVLDLTQARKPFTVTTLVSFPGSVIRVPQGRLSDILTIGTDTRHASGWRLEEV